MSNVDKSRKVITGKVAVIWSGNTVTHHELMLKEALQRLYGLTNLLEFTDFTKAEKYIEKARLEEIYATLVIIDGEETAELFLSLLHPGMKVAVVINEDVSILHENALYLFDPVTSLIETDIDEALKKIVGERWAFDVNTISTTG